MSRISIVQNRLFSHDAPSRFRPQEISLFSYFNRSLRGRFLPPPSPSSIRQGGGIPYPTARSEIRHG